MIGSRGGIDGEALQQAFDACVGTGDDSRSPVLRLARKLGLDDATARAQERRGMKWQIS
jgi:hypothetical protein